MFLGSEGLVPTHGRKPRHLPLTLTPPGSVCRSLEDSCLGLTSHPLVMPLNLKIRGCLVLIPETEGWDSCPGSCFPSRKSHLAALLSGDC